MLQTIKSYVLRQEWREAGGALQLTHPYQLDNPPAPFIPAHIVQGRDVQMSPAGMQHLTIKLASLINIPIKQLRILERYHRVFLVAYVPYGQLDPVLPVTAVNLGQAHNTAYAMLSNYIHSWDPNGDRNWTPYHNCFYRNCQPHAIACGQAAFERLEPDEAHYYYTQIQYSIAAPHRNLGHF